MSTTDELMRQIEDHEFSALSWKPEDIDGIIQMIRELRGDKRAPRKIAEEDRPKQKMPSLAQLGLKAAPKVGITRR